MSLPEPTLAAERAIIAAIILDPIHVENVGVFDTLTQLDFSDQRLGSAFAAAQALSRARSPIDTIAIRAACGHPEVTLAFLAETTIETVSASHARHHAKMVRAASMAREALKVFARGSCCVQEAMDGEVVVSEAIASLQALQDRVSGHATIPVHKAEPDLVDRIAKREPYSVGVQTGFHELDAILGGLRDGEVIVLAAQTSVGKSLLAGNICEHVTNPERDTPVPVLFFSLEMSAEMIYRRHLFARAKVNKRSSLQGHASDEDIMCLRDAHAELAGRHWYVNDSGRTTAHEVYTQVRRFQQEHGHCLVVVDYLQLLNMPGVSKPYERVSAVSRELKIIAKDLKVPVLELAQLSREATDRRDPDKRTDIKIPNLSDLRDSGSIEQDADAVIFIARDPKETVAHIVVAKNRNDSLGRCKLQWDPSRPGFANLQRVEVF